MSTSSPFFTLSAYSFIMSILLIRGAVTSPSIIRSSLNVFVPDIVCASSISLRTKSDGRIPLIFPIFVLPKIS